MTNKAIDNPTPPPSPPPPRGPKPAVLIGLVLLIFAAVLLGAAFGWVIPNVVRPALQFVGIGHDHTDDPAATTDEHGQMLYTCGMHPWIVLPKPGLCPICHMDLTPIDPTKFTGEVAIDPLIVQNIGVRVSEVVKGPLVKTIRTVGTVDYAEPSIRDVNIKVSGWIEKMHVDFLGAQVEQGQPLFDVYSPEVYSALQEYLLAYRNRGTAVQGATNLLDAARTRLLYYDVTPEQIEQLEQTGEPTKTISVLSPHTGVVIDKHANEGMNVDPGMRVYRIADLSKVWVLVTLYEYQLPYVQAGQRAVMTLPYIPGQSFSGEVIFVYPYLDKKTREVQVRLEFDNPSGLLKPGMFTNVELQSTLARERTLAPREAIIDTGERSVAFVSLGDGRFEPRDVRVGIEAGDGMVEILQGLEPGEKVVTSGQFLIDSEAKMREALAKMVMGESAIDRPDTDKSDAEDGPASLTGEADELLSGLLTDYFSVADLLAQDTAEGTAPPAERIVKALRRLEASPVTGDPHFGRKHPEIKEAIGHAKELGQANDLAEARLRFADLSVALSTLLRATGVPRSFGQEVQELHCPMYQADQGGGFWLQTAGEVQNPYFGEVMLRCFDARKTLPVTGAAATQPDAQTTQTNSPATQPVEPADAPEGTTR